MSKLISCQCKGVDFSYVSFDECIIEDSFLVMACFKSHNLSHFSVPKSSFEMLQKVRSLKGSKFSNDALSAEEQRTLIGTKGDFVLLRGDCEEDPLQEIHEYAEKFIQKEQIPNDKGSLNWPAEKEQWRYDPQWNRPGGMICRLNESPLLNLIRFYVHSTADNYSYRAMRYEFARFKKAVANAKLGEFLVNEWQNPPEHRGMAASITIHSVQILYNPVLWARYQTRKKKLLTVLADEKRPLQNVRWHSNDLPKGLPVLDERVGECWLFHGTETQEVMKSICKSGFLLEYVNKKIGAGYGALGRGFYFSDSFSKSTIYADCPKCKQKPCKSDCTPEDKRNNPKAIFLSRVLLGKPYEDKFQSRRNEEEPPEGFHSSWGPSDEFISDSKFDCNEFAVPKEDQAYPDYCIIYSVNPSVLNKKPANTLLPQQINASAEVKQLLLEYHRFIQYGTREQQLYQLRKLEDSILEYMEALKRNLDNRLAYYLSFLQTIKDERLRLKSRLKSDQISIDIKLNNSLPPLPLYYDAWIYRHDGIWSSSTSIISLCNYFLDNYKIEPPARLAYFYKQRGLEYFFDNHPFEMVCDFNQAWSLLKEEEAQAYLNCDQYFQASLKALKDGKRDPDHHEEWVRRVAVYFVKHSQKKHEEWEENYWNLKTSEDRECFRNTLLAESLREFKEGFPPRKEIPAEKLTFFDWILNLPNDSGERFKTAYDKKNWSKRWQKMLQEKPSEVKVSWLEPTGNSHQQFELREKYLHADYVEYLFDAKGELSVDAKESEGRSLTKLLWDGKHKPLAFIKFFPRFPLRQYFIVCLTQYLSGHGVMSTLVNIRHNNQPYGYPVLISQPLGNVKDKKATFAKRLNEEDECEKLLDINAFFWKYLEALLLSYKDDKNDNIALVELLNHVYRLISIDPDEALENNWANSDGVQVFSLIFLLHLAFQKKGWSQLVSKQYQQLNIDRLLNLCVNEVEEYCHAMRQHQLFSKAELNFYKELNKKGKYVSPDKTIFYNISCDLENLFRDDDLPRLHERMIRLQKILLELENFPDKHIPHLIMKKMDALLAYHYEIAYISARNQPVSQRFLSLRGTRSQFDHEKMIVRSESPLSSSNVSSLQLYSKTTTRLLTRVAITHFQPALVLSAQRSRWEAFCYQYRSFERVLAEVKFGDLTSFMSEETSNYVRESVLREILWNQRKDLAKKLLIEVQRHPLRFLKLSQLPAEPEVTKDDVVATIKKMPTLTEINIERCPQMRSTVLKALAQMPNLVMLTIRQMDLALLPKGYILQFAKLQQLTLENVRGVASLCINAPELKILNIYEEKITSVTLNSVKDIPVKKINKNNTSSDEDIVAEFLIIMQEETSNTLQLKDPRRVEETIAAIINNERKVAILEKLLVQKVKGSLYYLVMIDLALPVKSFTNLSLSGYEFLTLEQLKLLLNNSLDLKILLLAGCHQFDDKVVDLIADFCPQLETLDLSKTSITRINRPSLGSALGLTPSYFTKTWLLSLTVSECSLLKSVKVNAKHLTDLKMSMNTSLAEVDIVSEDIEELDLTHTPLPATLKITASNLKILSIREPTQKSPESSLVAKTSSRKSLSEMVRGNIEFTCPKLQLVYLNLVDKLPDFYGFYDLNCIGMPAVLFFDDHVYVKEKATYKIDNRTYDFYEGLLWLFMHGYQQGLIYLLNKNLDKLHNLRRLSHAEKLNHDQKVVRKSHEKNGVFDNNVSVVKKLTDKINSEVDFVTEVGNLFAEQFIARIFQLLAARDLDPKELLAYAQLIENIKLYFDSLSFESFEKTNLTKIIDVLFKIVKAETEKLRTNSAGLLLAFSRYVSLEKKEKLMDEFVSIIHDRVKPSSSNFLIGSDLQILIICSILYSWMSKNQIITLRDLVLPILSTQHKEAQRSIALYLAKVAMHYELPSEIIRKIIEILSMNCLRSQDSFVMYMATMSLSELLLVSRGEYSALIGSEVTRFYYEAMPKDFIRSASYLKIIFSLPSMLKKLNLFVNYDELFDQIDVCSSNISLESCYFYLIALKVFAARISSLPQPRVLEANDKICKFLDSPNNNQARILSFGPRWLVRNSYETLIPSLFYIPLWQIQDYNKNQINHYVDKAIHLVKISDHSIVQVFALACLVQLQNSPHMQQNKTIQIAKLLDGFLKDKNPMMVRIAFYLFFRMLEILIERRYTNQAKYCSNFSYLLRRIGFLPPPTYPEPRAPEAEILSGQSSLLILKR